MNEKREKVLVWLGRLFIVVMLIVIYLPIFFLMIYSFTPTKGFGVWSGFSFELYTSLFSNNQIMKAVANTLIIAVVSGLIATILGTMTAVGIFYMGRRGKALMNAVNQITIINADIVTAVALMLFFVSLSKIGLDIPLGYASLIIGHTMITTPYVILSVLPKLSQLNPNLYEAGQDLGAGPVRTLVTVILPQLLPGMIAGFALAFTLSLDDFVITKFTNGYFIDTISTLIYKSMRKGLDPAFRALSTLIFVLILAVLAGTNIMANRRKRKLASMI